MDAASGDYRRGVAARRGSELGEQPASGAMGVRVMALSLFTIFTITLEAQANPHDVRIADMLYDEFKHSQIFERLARLPPACVFMQCWAWAREVVYDNLATAVVEYDG
jgi:hypothetical protein